MVREVSHEARGPARFDADDLGDDGALYICQCGLSDEAPLCDGSHNETSDEEDGVLYKYEGDERRKIEEIIYGEG